MHVGSVSHQWGTSSLWHDPNYEISQDYRPQPVQRGIMQGEALPKEDHLLPPERPQDPYNVQEQAYDVAERLRFAIETNAGAAVRDIPGIRITSSFGVASIRLGAKDPAELIDQADKALYLSKQTGRNRVTIWTGEPAAEAKAQA